MREAATAPPCSAHGRRCGEKWQALNAMSANARRQIRFASGADLSICGRGSRPGHLLEKIGPEVGLTSSRNPSGERDISGGITKAGDVNLRRTLCQTATIMMHRGRMTWLRPWVAKLARRRGAKCAMVALARRIVVTVHRMWVDDTNVRSGYSDASCRLKIQAPTERGSGDVVFRADVDPVERAKDMGTAELASCWRPPTPTTDRNMHPARSHKKAVGQRRRSIVQGTRPRSSGAFRMRKSA